MKTDRKTKTTNISTSITEVNSYALVSESTSSITSEITILDKDYLQLSSINGFVLEESVFSLDIGVPETYQLAQTVLPIMFSDIIR